MNNSLRFRRLLLFRSRRKSLTRAAFVALVSALSLPLISPRAQAANYYWDPGLTNTDPGSGGTGTWNTTSAFWKLAGTSGDVVWPNTTAHTADFAGAAGTVTLGSAITAGGLIFDTAGYTLNTSTFALSLGTAGITSNNTSGTTTVNGSITSLGTQTWTTAAGGTLTVGATYTSAAATNYNLTLAGAGTVNFTGGSSGTPSVVTGVFTAGGGGTVGISGFFNTASTTAANTKFIVNGGSTVNWSATGTQSGIYTGIADGSAGTLNVTAGALTISPGTALFTGNNATGLLNITGGTVTIGSNSAIYLGNGFNGGGSTGSGTITISGGQFTTGVTTGNFTLGSAGTNTGTGTLNLNGGTFSSNRSITRGASANNSATVNFNGGTLQATGTALAISNTITTNIAEGGGTIDSQTFAITIATNFAHGGVAATDGGLKIASSAGAPGQVVLSGILSQTGGLTINSATYLQGTNIHTGATTISAFVDANNSSALGATGAGNGTTINTGGTFRFRDSSNKAIGEAFNFNGGTFLTYNDSGTTTLSGPITLNAATTISVSPQAQASTTLLLSGGIADGATTGNNLVFSRIGAAAAASNDVINVTGASTYGGSTAITDALNTNTGVFSVRLSGGDNRLPVGTTLTLGGTAGGGNAAGSGRLVLGDTTNGAVNQTLAGLLTSGTGTNNAVVGGATTSSTLTLNIATGTNTFGGLVGGIATNANNLALTKTGAGTLTLTGASTYIGATTINRGTLNLGGSTANGAIAGDGTTNSALVMGGGTLNYTRTGTVTQTFASTTFNSGGSAITTALSGETLALGAITRNSGGTVNFTNAGTITTITANTNSILGGYATYGLNTWAVSAGTGTVAGNITGLADASYLQYNNVSGLNGAGATSTTNLTDVEGYDNSYTTNLALNSLRFNSGTKDGNFGIVSGNNLTLTSGGILVTSNVGTFYQRIGYLNTNFNAGEGQGGITLAAPGDLVINQNSSSGHLEIYSTIFGTGVNLVKSGVGYLELRGLDASYNGSTIINAGTMKLTAAVTGTSAVTVNNTGTLLLGANNRVNDAATVTLNGGTINTGGFSEGASTGTSTATQGLGALTLSSSSTLDYGAGHSGSSVLAFANSSGQTWSGVLTLLDFTQGTDFLNFASNTGLTATQLGEISLPGYSATSLDSFGNVLFTAVPEPATWATGVLMVGVAGWGFRRQMNRRAV